MPIQNADAAIAENVRGAATEAKINLEELGAEAGIADRTWWRRMTGRSPWLVSEVIAVAEVLDCDVAPLLEAQKASTRAA
ncbi:hypothetical protein [Promicromonospora sp. NPDC023805]|uniref:hypothetical protein n=1 Tax=Promicromonospora sp. NPDC023805 TaxID=3154696 RepID=UPI0033CC25EC